MKKMTVEDKLGLDLFHTDDNNSHIQVNRDYDNVEEIMKVVRACPAECYKYIEGEVSFSHLGCLECGTCRVLSHGKLVESWEHPMGGIGVTFREG